MNVSNVSFFTLEAAVCLARSLSESDAGTYVVVKLAKEPRDPAAGPWSVLSVEEWPWVAGYEPPRAFCASGMLQCSPV